MSTFIFRLRKDLQRDLKRSDYLGVEALDMDFFFREIVCQRHFKSHMGIYVKTFKEISTFEII